MKLTMTLPTRIGQALRARADEFEMPAAEYLKSLLFAAAQEHGITLKLDLPPMSRGDEPELPLFETANPAGE